MKIPEFFKPILWSYNLEEIDPQKDKKTIIVQAVNYGDLKHWKWLIENYGLKPVREILSQIPVTELRPRVKKLVSIIFLINSFNNAPRGAN